jgi:surface protein
MSKAESGEVHNDENKCKPYILRGKQNFNIEWDNNFEDCSNMFEDITVLTEVDLSNFDVSRVKYMGLMFKGCTSLKKVIMPTISEYLLEQAEMMFKGCTKLISVQFQHDFRTINVKQMNEMFEGCSNLISVNFPDNFDTSNSNYINNMF